MRHKKCPLPDHDPIALERIAKGRDIGRAAGIVVFCCSSFSSPGPGRTAWVAVRVRKSCAGE
eukprot:7333674-Pyramimonas_sp.AAC.1